MKLLFIINPAAGNGRRREAPDRIRTWCRQRRIDCLIRPTGAGAAIADLVAEEMARHPDIERLVAIGGDGTIAETAGAAALAGLPLGIAPMGTGNDFARELGMDRMGGIEDYLAIAAGGGQKRIDLGRCRTAFGESFFINVASAGFDAVVTRSANLLKRRIRTDRIYLLAIITALPRFRFSRMTIAADGGILRRRALMAIIGNCRYYGGGMMINPNGRPDDGLLDLIIFNRAPLMSILRHLPGFLNGRHARIPFVEHHQCRCVRIAAEKPVPVNMDGEVRGETPLHAEILPGRLRVMIPEGRV